MLPGQNGVGKEEHLLVVGAPGCEQPTRVRVSRQDGEALRSLVKRAPEPEVGLTRLGKVNESRGTSGYVIKSENRLAYRSPRIMNIKNGLIE
ncbi:hypothetical protein NDU88_003746 [Pleurodeles waltl]|uniref:Uncharacterized protein n=1 Tax=Pleurodeles waltl TaxID=8319 RepID=A0AAV7W662_PLEWA|nr:hypothetical protein NDU88_003746 [Pleurodeles waltl]